MKFSFHLCILPFVLMSLISPNLSSQGVAIKPSVKISGELTQPLTFTVDDIAKMSHHTAILRDHSGKNVSYSGVSLQEILGRAGVTTGSQLRGKNLSKFLMVKCADGYEVLFSLAEVDSTFTNRLIILADSAEGKILPADKGPFRLIVPDEKKPARSCFQVVELVIRYAKE